MEDSSSPEITNRPTRRETSDQELPTPAAFQDDKKYKKKRGRFDFLNDFFPKNNFKPIDFDTSDVVAVVFFTFVGVFLRVFRIYYPQTPVFDEVHFGMFINNYIKGEYFTDIHPPFPKLIMAFFAYLGNYAGDYDFKRLQENKLNYPTYEYNSLRLVPAVFAGLVPVFVYLTVKFARLSSFAAFTCASFAALDHLLIIEGRIYVTDGILHFFSVVAMLSIFVYETYQNLPSLVAESLCLGFAISCKFTSGGILILALIRQFMPFHQLRTPKDRRDAIVRCSILISGSVVLLYFFYYIHLSILPYEPRDTSKIPDCIKNSLVKRDDPKWINRHTGSSYFTRITVLLLTSQRYNMKIKTDHPYSSRFYSWPLACSNWLLYWISDNQKNLITCVGSPYLWPALFLVTLYGIASVFITNNYNNSLAFFVFGYLLSYLPFMLIRRDTYLYHYCIPLIFSMMTTVCVLEDYLPPKIKAYCFSLLMTLAFLGFLVYACWCYGLTVPDINFLILNKNWPKYANSEVTE